MSVTQTQVVYENGDEIELHDRNNSSNHVYQDLVYPNGDLRNRVDAVMANGDIHTMTEKPTSMADSSDVKNVKYADASQQSDAGNYAQYTKGALSPFLKDMLPAHMAGGIAPVFRAFSTEDQEDEFEAQFDPQREIDYSDPSYDSNAISRSQKAVVLGCRNNWELFRKLIFICFLVCYTIYLGFAIAYSINDATVLIVITACVVFAYCYSFVRDTFGDAICEGCGYPFSRWWDRNWHIIKWILYPILTLFPIIYLGMVVVEDFRQLQSISGFIIFFLWNFLTSKHPDKVVWRPVIWGYYLQFILAILVLQWEPGYRATKWLSDLVTTIINFGYEGAALVFGDPMLILHPYAFMGMPLIIYVGSLMNVLYYYGTTQKTAVKMAWAFQVSMKTTAIETLGPVANIFLNGMDVMLMLRHYVPKLTPSEFNCFCVGGNATIAGFIFGLLILFGAPPQHLLTGAVMSAPATIAIAKLTWPETVPHLSKTKDLEGVKFQESTETNVFEAAANGSSVAGKTVAVVIVNYISFISILALIDASLLWIGERVGFYELSFEWICSYLFLPIALIIGIEWKFALQVGKVIGIKVFTTEVYAYQRLGQIYNAGLLDERSRAIATYALCGFCSLSTLAIAIGVWEAVIPARRKFYATVMIRVLVEANISCFTTACIAGLFYSEKLAIFETVPDPPAKELVGWVFGLIPSYKDLMGLAGM